MVQTLGHGRDRCPRAPAPTRDRDALVGLRQLRHALPRLPVARSCAGRDRAARRTQRSSTDLTGCCPRVALHIPWDAVEDYSELRRTAEEQGIGIGAINPEPVRRGRLPPRQSLQPGSRRADARSSSTAASASRSRSRSAQTVISLWLADGTNYPGQDDLRERQARLVDGLEQVYAHCRAACGCSSSTSSSSRASTAPTSPTGAPRRCCAVASARRRRSSSTPATIRRERTSSRSSRCCSPRGCSAASTSTTASTPTTT